MVLTKYEIVYRKYWIRKDSFQMKNGTQDRLSSNLNLKVII